MTLIRDRTPASVIAAEFTGAACHNFFSGAKCLPQADTESFCRMEMDPDGSTPRYIRHRNIILGESLDALFIQYKIPQSDTKDCILQRALSFSMLPLPRL
jgi:hypothetical protein